MQHEHNMEEEPIIQLSSEPTTDTTTKKEPNYMLPAAVLITGLLIAGSIVYAKAPSAPALSRGTQNNQNLPIFGQKEADTRNNLDRMAPVGKTDHVRGDISAPIMLVEYSDLECPYCKDFHQTMRRLMSEYGAQGKLSWVYRDFPIESLHNKAFGEAEAAECAGVVGGNDKYWQYVDEVFTRTNSNNSLDLLELPRIAQDMGLDTTSFMNCVTKGLATVHVQRDLESGKNLGIQGTPYAVFINTKTGQKSEIPGAVPYEVMKQMIDTTLSQIERSR